MADDFTDDFSADDDQGRAGGYDRDRAGEARRGAAPRSSGSAELYERTSEYSRPAVRAEFAEDPPRGRGRGPVGAKPSARPDPYQRPERPQMRKRPDFDDFLEDDEYDDPFEDDLEPKPKRNITRWIVSILAVVLLLAGITFVGRNRPDLVQSAVVGIQSLLYGPAPTPAPTPEPTPEPEDTPGPAPDLEASAVVSFTSNVTELPDLSTPMIFEVITSADTDRVHIVDSNGQTLVESIGSSFYTDTDEGRVWRLMYSFEEAYSGYVEVYPGNESGWNEARGSRLTIQVGDAGETTGEAGGPSAAAAFARLNAPPLSPVSVMETIRTKNETIPSFTRPEPIRFGDADVYSFFTTQAGDEREGMKGVLTFRGNNMRSNAAYGAISAAPAQLETAWTAGVGTPVDGDAVFGAQPLLVQWHQQFREQMEPMNAAKRDKRNLVEIIFAASDGNLYYFDLDDGTKTRETHPVDAPMLGTPALYPRGIPVMFVGTGIPGGQSAAMLTINMLTGKNFGNLVGSNDFATSLDHTFITSPLIHSDADTTLAAGGNGIFYTLLMNTTINPEDYTFTFETDMVLLATDSDGADDAAQSSFAAYGEHAYIATMGGVLKSIDINAMAVDWALNLGGETYAAIALNAHTEGDPLLYAVTVTDPGASVIRCINAKTGALVWEASASGAIKASPLMGERALDHMICFTAPDKIIALDKTTGDLLWETPLSGAKAASPIALYDDSGTGHIIQGDGTGLHLLDGATGTVQTTLPLDSAAIGSPAAYDDTIVVATEAGTLYGARLR